MQLLFWRAVQQACADGLAVFDLGRSDCDAAGLLKFKERWASTRSTLTYWRYPEPSPSRRRLYRMHVAQRVVGCMPAPVLTAVGRLLYKHAG